MFRSEQLLENHFPTIGRLPLIGKTAAAVLRRLLREDYFRFFMVRNPDLRGVDYIDALLDELQFNFSVNDSGRQHIPTTGATLIVANHPTGSLDGLALIKWVASIRPDVKVMANQVLANAEPIAELMLPVDNMGGKSQRQQLEAIGHYLRDGGALIVFPAGEVSRFGMQGIKDGPWRSSFIGLARRYDAPVVPVRIKARNSVAFYSSTFFLKPLSTLLLVKEMFRHKRRDMNIFVGSPITAHALVEAADTVSSCARVVKRHVYRLGTPKQGLFRTFAPVADAEPKQRLVDEIETCESLGVTPDGKCILLYKHRPDSAILREIGRLREMTFRSVSEGTGRRLDLDVFDRHYMQLLLWDSANQEIVGAYRIGSCPDIIASKGEKGLYTGTLFRFGESIRSELPQSLELGRSFVQPKYQGKRSLDYIWMGIGAMLRRYPQYRYMFGAVTISPAISIPARRALVFYFSHYYSHQSKDTSANNPYLLNTAHKQELQQLFVLDDATEDFVRLKHYMASLNERVPTLFKQYVELTERGGTCFFDFGVDPDFADSVDALVRVDLHQLKPAKHARYIVGKTAKGLSEKLPVAVTPVESAVAAS